MKFVRAILKKERVVMLWSISRFMSLSSSFLFAALYYILGLASPIQINNLSILIFVGYRIYIGNGRPKVRLHTFWKKAT